MNAILYFSVSAHIVTERASFISYKTLLSPMTATLKHFVPVSPYTHDCNGNLLDYILALFKIVFCTQTIFWMCLFSITR